jgi:hypothetical protein
MRNLAWVGVLLIALGVIGLVVQNISYTETETVLDVGPLELEAEQQRNVPIPTIGGIIAVIAGVVLVIASRRGA